MKVNRVKRITVLMDEAIARTGLPKIESFELTPEEALNLRDEDLRAFETGLYRGYPLYHFR